MSLPLLVLMLLHLHRLLTGPRGAGALALHGLLVFALFLLHPFTLQVFMVLAAAMTLLVGRDRNTLLLGTAPLALFVLLPFVAAIPLGRAVGGLLAIICIALSLQSAQLHHKIASELESYTPVFDNVPGNARLLPLLGITSSEYLDSFFYARFYSHFPFYYHVLKGGGINPDMFRARLMPVAYKPGVLPSRPPQNDLGRWAEHADQYDYILLRNVPPQVIKQLQQRRAELVGFAGEWGVVKLP